MAGTEEREFNPIKEQIGGKKAEKVVWSSNVINYAIDGIKKGLPLKANPFVGKNTSLLKPNLVRKYTDEELADYIHCKKDPVYFAEKCYMMTPEGLSKITLRDYQVQYLHHLQNNRFSILLAARQSGKSTTTALYCLWMILFNSDKTGLILSKSGAAAADLLKKIKDMYLYLPYHLKIGTNKWNQSEISFDNNSSISIESFGPTAGLGKTINFLILDEFAWCPQNDVELFYENIIPTVTTITDSNVCIMSTQNGFNKFYTIWKGAIEKKNIYAPFKIDWYQVPQWNPNTKTWDKRDEKWKEMMIGVLGSEEAFYYQYGTQFSASDLCLVNRECLSRLRDNTLFFENRSELPFRTRYGEFYFWKPGYDLSKLRTNRYVILVDLAEGGGGDSTVFNILEITGKDTFEQIGYWKSNTVDLENAALEFWTMACQLFNDERCLISIEWNTYGALFYKTIQNLNDSDYDASSSWRFTCDPLGEGLDLTIIVKYKKVSIEDEVSKGVKHTSSFVPGIKFTGSNKKTACSLLKMEIEKGNIVITDLVTIGELENFEDKTGSGSYKASYGHDDLIMTFCQIPMLKETPKYKDYMEEFESTNISNSIDSKWNDSIYDYDNMTYYDNMSNMSNLFNDYNPNLQ